MSQGEDILSQADALMHRHRSFVARSNSETDHAPPPQADVGAVEIPLLTEIVQVARSTNHEHDRSELNTRIEREFADWLDQTLPQHLEKLIKQIGEQLLSSLAEEAKASLLPRLQAALEDKRTVE